MAADAKWRTTCRGAVLFAIFIQVINGYEVTYTISQLSPKSIIDNETPRDVILETSQVENVPFSIEPSIKIDDNQLEETIDEEHHHVIARSIDPVRESRSINIDEIPTSNNEIDSEIELHNKRKYYDIHPTKTVDYLRSINDDVILPSDGFGDRLEFRFPGEAKRVPKARALGLSGPKIRPTAVQPIFATATPREEGRQNSEIQNIITGIVKLLNGNVNVQANTQLLNGRPGRPMNSRINNRGPPRISDVPPLPDFEKVSPPPHMFMPTKSPPPYPFDRPPLHGVNLPEQIVPPLTNNRPGFHRPLPPWQRPRPRPPNRRPNPGPPMYKPTPPLEYPIQEFEERPEADTSLSENETAHSENNIHDDKVTISITNPPETITDDREVETTTVTTSTTTSEAPTTTEKLTTTTKKTTTTEKATTTEKPTTTEKSTTTEKPTTTSTTTTTTTTEKPTTTTEKITTEKPKPEPPKKVEKEKKKDTQILAEKEKPPKVKTDDKINRTVESVLDFIKPSVDTSTMTITSSIETSTINTQPLPTYQDTPYQPYRPRPGIVLDDPEFKPQGSRRRPDQVSHARPPGYGETFHITVSAIQGPGGGEPNVHIENVNLSEQDDIIVSPSGEQGFVSIDGKRTYLNLFDTSTASTGTVAPTRVVTRPQTSAPPSGILGAGEAIPADDVPLSPPPPPRSPAHPTHRPPFRRPHPTVRIDTCIVGDDSTCDKAQNEMCRTEAGISSCQCRPGYARRTQRDPCRRIVSLVLNMRVDRLYDRKMSWDNMFADRESEKYQQLSYEALRAIDSAFSMTPFSDDFVSSAVNTVHHGDPSSRGVFINYTILMQETPETVRSSIATDIQKHLLGVIRRRSNNVGASNLWVDSPAGTVLPLVDLDECASPELNDCHQLATCTNTWGGFRCACPDTTLDLAPGVHAGRQCKGCAASHCNDRGVCKYAKTQPYCSCTSGYYGSTCEVDGEVVGVAVGASLAAALVIALTLAALMSWSRKWSREQKAMGMGSPVFNYMAANTVKTPPVGQPPYQVTLEERMRWAQIAEAMAQASHYGGDVQAMATRPSSAMFGGYPTLPPVPLPRMGLHGHGTLNTVASRANTAASHHNMYGYSGHVGESTSSEASSHVQDRADLLVPRPKSRARSMHNQTGIYYDVDYENAPESLYGTKGIPLSTYTVSRGPPFYRT